MDKIKINQHEDILTVSKMLLKNGNDHMVFRDGIKLIGNNEVIDNICKTKVKMPEIGPLFFRSFDDNIKRVFEPHVGDKINYLKYAGQPIEWEVVEKRENRELIMCSTKILEAIAFNDDYHNNEYKNSKIEKWCKSISNNVFIPRKKQFFKWYPTDELRRCCGTRHAIENGLYVNDDTQTSSYYTNDKNPASNWYTNVGSVHTSGAFNYHNTYNSAIGARPAIRLYVAELF